jgi:urease accessory protein
MQVDRLKLYKRRWRGAATDGEDFGFEVDKPLTHGDCFYLTETKCYVITQQSEPALEIDFTAQLTEGLHVAWSIGNLHMSMQSLDNGIRVADDPAVRQLFQHLDISFKEVKAIFEPIRSSTDIGHAHTHTHGHDHTHDHSH